MDFFKVLDKRKSVRHFKKKEVPYKKILKMIAYHSKAPSAGNLESYQVRHASITNTKQALARAAYNQAFLANADIIMVFFAIPSESGEIYGQRGRELYSVQDATIAATYAMLSATALGLASCWIGAFDDKLVREVFDVDEEFKPVALLPIGYEKKVKA
jgi:nitroreductase